MNGRGATGGSGAATESTARTAHLPRAPGPREPLSTSARDRRRPAGQGRRPDRHRAPRAAAATSVTDVEG
ncbi:hypothetical protein GCM10009864_18540 [Streptomyces lunalinharesii]|uniref:Uncharacterized protein n=1 Tax=Streptomyces lunalinharesii TaxID=333384 RepID=A0ABP6DW77_9ACTN